MNAKLLKKISIWAMSIAIGVGIVAALAGLVKYQTGKKSTYSISVPAFTLSPAKDAKLGEKILINCLIECPWHRFPVSAEILPGKGSQSVSTPKIYIKKISWGKCTWSVNAEIQAYLNGKIDQGKADIEFNSCKDDKYKTMQTSIPAFEVKPLDVGNSKELSVAGKITKESFWKKHSSLIIAIIVLIIILIAAYFFFRKRKEALSRIVPPWETALFQLDKLRREFKNNSEAAALCLSKLTDIARNYLEKRFHLHAPSQTTPEFLEELRRDKSPLKDEDKDFLREFMMAADLVKFANMPADMQLLENAIAKAENLVKSTVPAIDEKSGKEKTK